MSDYLTIGSISGLTNLDFITAAFTAGVGNPAAGIYMALPPFGNSPVEHGPMYEEEHIGYEGMTQVATKRRYFRGRIIHIDLIAVGTSQTTFETQRKKIDGVAALARYTVTLPGGTAREGCKLVVGSLVCGPKFSLGTGIAAVVSFDLISLKE